MKSWQTKKNVLITKRCARDNWIFEGQTSIRQASIHLMVKCKSIYLMWQFATSCSIHWLLCSDIESKSPTWHHHYHYNHNYHYHYTYWPLSATVPKVFHLSIMQSPSLSLLLWWECGAHEQYPSPPTANCLLLLSCYHATMHKDMESGRKLSILEQQGFRDVILSIEHALFDTLCKLSWQHGYLNIYLRSDRPVSQRTKKSSEREKEESKEKGNGKGCLLRRQQDTAPRGNRSVSYFQE